MPFSLYCDYWQFTWWVCTYMVLILTLFPIASSVFRSEEESGESRKGFYIRNSPYLSRSLICPYLDLTCMRGSFRVVTVRRSTEFAKCQSPPWKTRAYSSIDKLSNFGMSFLWIHWKETYKSMDPTSIPPKLSAGNSFNKMEKLDHQLFEIWDSCGFYNQRDLWKTMHRQSKCWKLSWSTDGNEV